MESLSLIGRPLTAEPVFPSDLKEHAEDFGRKPFLLRHNLANCDLFELPRLKEAGRALLDRPWPAQDGHVSLPEWKPASAKAKLLSREDQLAKAFDELESDSFASPFKLSAINTADPAYDAFMRRGVQEIAEQVGILQEEITWSILTIFISPSRSVTPFHGDYDQNCLLQVRGEKDVRIYDPADRTFFPQDALEELCKGNPVAARYRDEFKNQGAVFHLEPGLGIHHPITAPHSVINGNYVSVSVAIAFCTKEADEISRVHQANLFLRSAGFKPPFPDLSRRIDRFKADFFRRISGPRDSCSALSRGYSRLTWPARRLRDALRKGQIRQQVA